MFTDLVDLLRQRATHQPQQTIYTFLADGEQQEVSLTSAQLDQQVRALAAQLQALGAAGERILLLYPPGLDFITAFFGCLYAGAVAVPAYPPHPSRIDRTLTRLVTIIKDAQPRLILTTAPIRMIGQALFANDPELQQIGWLASDSEITASSDDWRTPQPDAQALAFLQYTSGSTGQPKGTMLSHGNLLANLALIQQLFGHTTESRGVIWLPPYHDMGLIGGILQPLYAGFPVTLLSPVDFLQRPLRWLQAITRERATTSGGPNFAYDLCVRKTTPEQRAQLDLSSWQVAFNGAEPIRPSTLTRFAEAFADSGFNRRAFYPCYGLAEATLIVSGGGADTPLVRSFQPAALTQHHALEADPQDAEATALVASGQPAPGQQVVIVNPETLRTCPPDTVGEVWVAGPSVAQGYWRQEEASQATFQARLPDSEAGPFLRTGDLGFLQDGQLYITGRLKDVIIVRGRNHYPQDIERTVEASHPALRPGCGAAFAIELGGEERLVVVQEIERQQRTADLDAIATAVRQAVAEQHELQVYDLVVIKTGSIPKTSSGKIQRRTCRDEYLNGQLTTIGSSTLAAQPTDEVEPAPEPADLRAELQAATPEQQRVLVERFLIGQVARVLGLPTSQVAVQEPVPALGLDSLSAVELQHTVETSLGPALPLTSFLGSVAQLTDELCVQLAQPATPPEQPTTAVAGVQPLSYGQRALWFIQRLAPESTAYNLSGAVRIRSELDSATLQQAFQLLLERHAALRAVFVADGDGVVQQVEPQGLVAFQQADATSWSEAQLRQQLSEAANQPFDLAQPPLLRVHLFDRGPEDHVLLLVIHHIVADFWSLALLLRELATSYAALRGQTAALEPLESNYYNYIDWQNSLLAGPQGQQLWDYWQRQLAGELPVLQLPIARPRPPVQTYRGASHAFAIEPELAQQTRQLSAASGTTLFMTLLAAFQVLLYRYTGQPDLLVGTPTAGRSRARFAQPIGYFVNPIVLRGDLTGKPSFRALLERTRQTVLDGFAHQDYPFALLAERLQTTRDPSRSPLFQVMFSFQRAPLERMADVAALALNLDGVPIPLDHLPMESVAIEQQAAPLDLTLSMAEVGGQLAASFQYNTDLFEADTIAALAEHFVVLLAGLMQQPDASIATAPLLRADQRQRMLGEWNTTAVAYPACCAHQLIEQQAERRPTATAVVFEDAALTYQELDERANQLAHYLRRLGVGPEVRVGIAVERSLELIVGLLGILKAGGAYVPLDPSYPAERLAFVIEDAAVPVLLTQQHLRTRLPEHQARTVTLDSDWAAISRESTERLAVAVSPDNLMYTIYTSGSTGKPKGVMLAHRQAVNFFTGMDQRVGCDETDTVLAVTSISFDISVLELFWTLARGAKVVLLSEQAASGALARPTPNADRELEFSLFYFASNEQRSGRDKYRLLLDGARFADANGFTAVWTPERHFHPFGGLFPNPSVTGAAIAAVTQHVQIRGGSVVMPLHRPLRVAEEWSVVDNISNGRAGVAFASGWHSDDFAFFPDHYAERKRLTLDGIATVQRLWRGEAVTVQGGAGNEISVQLYPQPVQPTLPTWLTAAGQVETFEQAGAHGMNLLTHLLGQSLDELAEKIQRYRASRVRHGHAPESGRVTLMLHTFVGDDHEAVRALVREPFTQYLRSSVGLIQNFISSMNMPLDLKTLSPQDTDDLFAMAFQRYFETSALFGTPESCQALLDRVRAIGVDEVACLIDFGVDEETVLAQLPSLVEARELANRRRPQVDYSLAAQAARHQPTIFQCTPSMMQMLGAVPETIAALRSLRVLLLGGEALPPSLAAQLVKELPCQLINMYGPTETTVWSTTHAIGQGDEVLIGRPIANTSIYILDEQLQPVPPLVPGQLHIGGAGLARGYHQRPDLTAERFIPNPFAALPHEEHEGHEGCVDQPTQGQLILAHQSASHNHAAESTSLKPQASSLRLYSTGDLARYRPDGTIEYLGRIDAQVKLRGFRIELEEIEHVLSQSPDVRTCAVVVREDTPGDQRLVAYVVAGAGARPTSETLRHFLRLYLPDYMVPAIVMLVEALPYTANGKLDRRALPAPRSAEAGAASSYVAPRSSAEQAIAQIWQEVLKVERVGINENFFDLGGHSLLLARVQSQINERFQQSVALLTLFEHPTVRGMAEFIVAGEQGALKVSNSARSRAQQQQAARQRRVPRGEVQ